jgi:hypothetical protein
VGIEPRALHMLSKHCTTEVQSQPQGISWQRNKLIILVFIFFVSAQMDMGKFTE